MGNFELPSAIREALDAAKKIVVVSHMNPDADAYGASLGMFHALTELGKTTVCLNESGAIERYAFIPGVKDVQQSIKGDWDLLIVCDCGTFARVGDSVKASLLKIPVSINLDHHVSNDLFGTHNLIMDSASSTAEIVFDLLMEWKGKVSDKVAMCLLAGIVGDTGSFRYSSTTARTFLVAHDLCLAGASPSIVSNGLYGSTTLSSVLLQAEALTKLTMHFDNRVGEVVVPNEMVEKYKATLDDTDGLVERVRDIAGICIAVSIRQDKGIWRVSLRSSTPAYNVSDVAASFGGGGHRQAAAFRCSKPLNQFRPALLEKLKGVLG